MGAAGGWLGVLQFLHRTPFGARTPCSAARWALRVHAAGDRGRDPLGIAVHDLALSPPSCCTVVRRDIVVFAGSHGGAVAACTWRS